MHADRRMTRRSCAAIALAVALAAGGGAASASAAAKRTTCKSGTTRYAAGGVRIFQVRKRFTDLDGSYQQFLACRPGSRKPIVLDTSSFMTSVKWRGATRSGPNVVFEVEHAAETNSSVTVGWFAPASGARRSGSVLDEVGRPVAVAVAGDGAIVVVLDSLPTGGPRDELIAYMAAGVKGKLKDPRVLAGVTGGVVHGSLAIDGSGGVTWTTNAGAPGKATIGSAASAASLGAVAARSTKPQRTTCASGTTRFEHAGVRILELNRTDADGAPHSLRVAMSRRGAAGATRAQRRNGGISISSSGISSDERWRSS